VATRLPIAPSGDITKGAASLFYDDRIGFVVGELRLNGRDLGLAFCLWFASMFSSLRWVVNSAIRRSRLERFSWEL
jgi:hypothetical protein